MTSPPDSFSRSWRLGILTISDACSKGLRQDASGAEAIRLLAAPSYQLVHQAVIPDDQATIANTLIEWSSSCDLIITTGGTGLAPRDITPEATTSVIDRPVPGISEYLRSTGMAQEPRAILSRGVSGIRGACLIINLPGNPRAVTQGLEALLPLLDHALRILTDYPTEHSSPTLNP